MGSPLDLRRPYDLISLLNQEKRWTEIQTVLQDLMTRKTAIEEKWSSLDDQPGTKTKLKALENSDCLMNVKLLSNTDLYQIATNGSDRVKITLPRPSEVKNLKSPGCKNYKKITFNLPEYKNFPSLNSEDNISLIPDETLERLMPPNWPSVEHFGHQIHQELVKNSSSWVHYNLGALFWRIKGEGQKAIECSKQALFFAPQNFRDIVLHNLAGALHKGGRTKEAALLLHMAVNSAPREALHYLALGNVYFALGDCNSSLVFYDSYLEIKPGHKEVTAVKQATLCFSRLETHLIDFQK